MQETITIRGKWTVELLKKEMMDDPLPPVDWKLLGISLCVFLFGISMICGCWAVSQAVPTADYRMFFLVCMIFGTLSVAFAWMAGNHLFERFPQKFALLRRARNALKEIHPTMRENTFTFSPDFLSCEINGTENHVKWSSFTSCSKNENFIVLYGPWVYSIPRAWVPDDATWQSILALIDAKISSAPSAPTPTP